MRPEKKKHKIQKMLNLFLVQLQRNATQKYTKMEPKRELKSRTNEKNHGKGDVARYIAKTI